MNQKEDRFQNYISDIEPETTCKAFLEKGKKKLVEIRTNEENLDEFKVYKALGHKLRYHIYKMLEIKPMCTCALARLFQKPDSSITYHLKILQNAELIIGRKQGYYTIYHTKKNFVMKNAK